MFTTVVVPLDGSPRAASTLELAAELARRAGAALELVTVASPGLDLLDHELALKAACGDVEGVPCAWRVIESNEVDVALAGAVTDTDAILCMATHARTGIARAALGSTAEATVRAATRPVVLVGPHAQVPEDWDVVQACIEPTSELSRRAVPVAVALTRLLGARLWLVEVEPARQLRSGVDVPESAGVAALATALRRDGLDVEWDVLHGDDVAAELLSSQRTLGSSVLVTSSHARRGLTRAALGSVTTSLVHDAVCPVLVVPPTAAGRT
ncbi:MAG TPA: universal stress protein [Acidimicrobiales bacterium]|nr:universal stress protein [Acidimicrobiales bacterium]